MAETSEKMIQGGGIPHRQRRESNLELFRIVTMLSIVAHHYVVNSGVTEAMAAAPTAWRTIFIALFGAWGKTGINCFVLITGYFMCTSRITAKKFCKLLFEVEFYKILFYAIFLGTGYVHFSFRELLKVVLPVTGLSTDFTACYLLFYLCIPFLNILLAHLNERRHLLLVGLSLLIYTGLGTIPGFHVTMNYVSWFIVLYFLASYLRLYPKPLFSRTALWGWMTLLLAALASAGTVFLLWLSPRMGREAPQYMYWLLSDSNKAPALAVALSAFLFFKNLKMKPRPFINAVAASAFGVLLIHANSDTMRQWLWRDTLDNLGHYGSPYLVLHAVGSVVGIFAVCAAVDALRRVLLERPLFRFWDCHEAAVAAKLRQVGERVAEKLHLSASGD